MEDCQKEYFVNFLSKMHDDITGKIDKDKREYYKMFRLCIKNKSNLKILK